MKRSILMAVALIVGTIAMLFASYNVVSKTYAGHQADEVTQAASPEAANTKSIEQEFNLVADGTDAISREAVQLPVQDKGKYWLIFAFDGDWRHDEESVRLFNMFSTAGDRRLIALRESCRVRTFNTMTKDERQAWFSYVGKRTPALVLTSPDGKKIYKVTAGNIPYSGDQMVEELKFFVSKYNEELRSPKPQVQGTRPSQQPVRYDNTRRRFRAEVPKKLDSMDRLLYGDDVASTTKVSTGNIPVTLAGYTTNYEVAKPALTSDISGRGRRNYYPTYDRGRCNPQPDPAVTPPVVDDVDFSNPMDVLQDDVYEEEGGSTSLLPVAAAWFTILGLVTAIICFKKRTAIE